MRSVLNAVLLLLVFAPAAYGQSHHVFFFDQKSDTPNVTALDGEEIPGTQDQSAGSGLRLEPFLDIPENEGDFFSSLKPGVFLGSAERFKGPITKADYDLKVGVFFASPARADAPEDYISALLSPGTMNFILSTNIITPQVLSGFKFKIPSISFGLKMFPGLADSTHTMVQHSLGLGGAIQVRQSIMVYGQMLWGWHNMTSESENSFNQAFGQMVDVDDSTQTLLEPSSTSFRQSFIGIQFSIGQQTGRESYMYLEWRWLDKYRTYEGFGDHKFITLGFRSAFGL